MINKYNALSRALLIFAGLFMAFVLAGGPVFFYAAAQNPEDPKLFIHVDPSKTDLTQTQEDSLAHIKRQGTTADTRLVRIRTELLTPSPLRVQVNVGLGKQFEVQTTETRPRVEGFTWIGKPLAPSDAAVLIVNDGNVTGTVRTGNDLFAVRPLGGGLHVIVRQDQNKFPPEHPPEFEQREKDAPKEIASSSTADVSDVPKVLRILVAYTPKVATAGPDIDAFVNLAIAETNLGYTNSKINIRAELAYAYKVNYQESGKHDTDLDNFRNNNDSLMDEIHDLRNTHKADVCVLLVDNDSYCGTADAILATESSAFAVVHYTCATGYYSFAHEIGHLQGARHNKEADPEVTPFSYGHGYYDENEKWRTIMSYNCSAGCPRLPYWANPNVQYRGVAMGTDAESNDSRVLNETASTITAFRN